MPPRPPQRAGVVVQLTDELLELYSLDTSQPAVRQTSTHKVGCTMGYAKNASGSRLFPSYRRVSVGGVYSQPLPSLVMKRRTGAHASEGDGKTAQPLGAICED